MRAALGLVLTIALLVGGAGAASGQPTKYDDPERATTSGGTRPLAGRVVVIDPGHQLGNARFTDRINRLVPAGGFRKPCNTTGTSTNGGYPEATFNWQVARLVKSRLERAGARVVLTRSANSRSQWGPCVDRRGRAGNRAGADLKISIHADGSHAGGPGFHVIASPERRRSVALAKTVRSRLRHAGLPVAGYIAGGDGLDVRDDLATLNLSDMPAVMVEIGNMRSRPDARRMTSRDGRLVYARALSHATRRFLLTD